MKVLFIAPLPPPITGHALAARVLLDDLARSNDVAVVNLSVASSNDGRLSMRRLREVAKVLLAVRRGRRGADAIYLTIAESLAGNVKDLLIYFLCVRQLPRFYVHLHGGSIKKQLFDRRPVIRWLNSLAIRRLGGVLISGRSHEHIFDRMIDGSHVHIVPNFAQDALFVSDESIRSKFADDDRLRVLYLSGMTAEKGCDDLVDAYHRLSSEAQRRVRIDFAGRFDSDAARSAFLEQIRGATGIQYHGVVDDPTKHALFANAHVFCLPTTMFEGQPISILEAYASGCVVVTTGQDGIRDVFTDGVNGLEVLPGAPASLADSIEQCLQMARPSLAAIALHNRAVAASDFRADRFSRSVSDVLGASFDAPVAPSRDDVKPGAARQSRSTHASPQV